MLSIANISAAHASSYYSNGDYYTKDTDIQGEWFGKGAEKLALFNKDFAKADFENLLIGKRQDTQGIEIDLMSHAKNNHAAGIDLTFSAPKSVSIVAELQDEHLQQLHQQAVKSTLEFVQDNYIYTRAVNSQTGKLEYQQEHNLTATLFIHHTSRELDPQLHTHCVLHNITFDDQDSKVRTAYFKEIFNNKKFLGGVYRQELAKELQTLGYELTWDKKHNTFEIAGISSDLLQNFSTRRQQIEAKLDNAITQNLNKAKASAQVTLLTRKTKEHNVNENLLKEQWKTVAQEHQCDLTQLNSHAHLTPNEVSLRQAVNQAVEHLQEHSATFSKEQLIQTIEQQHPAVFSISVIQQYLSKPSTNLYYNALSKTYTTATHLANEQTLIRTMLQTRNSQSQFMSLGKQQRQLNSNSRLTYHQLNTEQRQTVDFVLHNKDQFMAIQGYAGTGKTFTIKALNELLQRNNYHMLGLAPTNSAVHTLANEAGIKTSTLQSFLLKYEGYLQNRGEKQGLQALQQDFKRTIVLVDEASLADTKQLKDLSVLASKLNFRVILQGDIQQLEAVGAGTPFRILQEQGIATTKLSNIQRQKEEQLKAAVLATVNHNIQESFQQLDSHIIEVNANGSKDISTCKQEIVQQIVKQYLALSPETRAQTLIITPANETRKDINLALREQLLNSNATSLQLQSLAHCNLTAVEKRDPSNYVVGNYIMFNKEQTTLGLYKDTAYKIESINNEQKTITVLTQDNQRITLDITKLKNLEVLQNTPLNVQVGEQLKWTRTFKEAKIFQGEALTVKAIDDKQQILTVQNNQTQQTFKLNLQTNFLSKHLDYNYTTTAYSAQGKTAKNVILALESYRTNLSNQKNFYVEISRAKHNLTIVTDNKQQTLERLLSNPGDKTASIDVFNPQKVATALQTKLEPKIKHNEGLEK